MSCIDCKCGEKPDIVGKLEFNLDAGYTKRQMLLALKANDLKDAIDEIFNRIFRPTQKHGYDQDIEKLVDACGFNREGYSNGYELIDGLREIYIQILEDLGDLDD